MEANRVKGKFQKSDKRNTRKGHVLKPSVSALFLLFAICNSLQAQENSKTSPGETIFKTKCILCHGPDGSGNTPLGKQLQAANLGSKEVQKLSNAEMHKIVHDGRANMPAFAEQLSDQEINQVIQYVRQFGKTAKKK